jgi:uncharacterized protein (TIGR02680 family)
LTPRFKPTRAGLLNLFEYGNQVFEFADGHLLLRGHNGAGKSKALELLLPFVLDGDTHPAKLDPFATTARQMKWNLTLGGAHESRWGYAWLEFARDVRDRAPEYVTLAVGVRAHQQQRDPQTWFIILRGHRLGHDISLLNPSTGTPLLRRGIADALGDGVEVFDVASEYRARVNAVLFGFPTPERYETMLQLQRQLRRPQLSKSLDPQRLSDILSDALPEVDGRRIADIGTHLDTIEQLRRDLRAFTDVRDALQRFVETYRAYAGAVVYEHGEAVTSSARATQDRSKTLEEKQVAAQACGARIAELDEQLARLNSELEGERGAERELLSSDAMRSATELRELEEHVAALDRELKRLTRDVREALEEREQHDAAAKTARDEASGAGSELDDACADLDRYAADAGVAEHEALIAELTHSDEPAVIGRLLADAASAREGQVREQERLSEDADRARFQAGEREQAAEACEAQERTAREQLAIGDGELATAREALVADAQAWLDGLAVLVPSDAEVELLLDVAARAGERGPGTLRRALDDRFDIQDSALVRAKAQVDAERRQVEVERELLVRERDELRAARDPEPERPHTRLADRAERPGAPLWRVVDFADELAENERAGLEAALEASGLLDAWLTTDGELLDLHGELVLTAGESAEGPQLGEALGPVAGAEVGEAVVARVLRAIGLGDTRSGSGVRVALDGSYRLGPAFGRFTKEAAQYVGVAAREANRARRLAELESRIADLDLRTAGFESQLAATDEQRQTLREELRALPSEDATMAAFAAVRDIQRDVVRLTAEAQEARRIADAGAAAAAKSARVASDYGRAHGLPADAGGLENVRAALAGYRGRLSQTVLLAHTKREREAAVGAAEQLAETMEARRARADAECAIVERELNNRRGALTELQRLHGDSVRDTLARLEELGKSITTLDQRVQHAGEERTHQYGEERRLGAEAAEAGRLVEAAERVAGEALRAFRELAGPRFFELALPDAAPSPQDIQRFSAAQVVAFMRRHRHALGGGSISVEALTDRVDREAADVRVGIDGSLGIHPYVQRRDGLVIVGAARGGHDQPIHALLASLDEEIEAQERTLTEADQKTFERFLFDGIAQHLRLRITAARQLVEDTNRAIASCQTSSGKGIELAWESLADDDPLLRRALKLLKRSPETLSEQERSLLISFFRDRVEQARQSEENGTAEEHLLDALDYRRWHRFRVFQTQDGDKVLLTRRQHEAGSGGEKAAALHLPLFAAAAAHMQSAAEHAPRLIMLDEAFAGIDGKMRSQLLGLIEHFKLDFMLTSHELWCCERELRHLSIYQLHREDGVPGVATVRFLWDGAAGQRTEVEDRGVAA